MWRRPARAWPLVRATRPKDIPKLAAIIRRTMPVDYAGLIPSAQMRMRVDEMVASLRGRWPLALTAQAGREVAGVALMRGGGHLSLLWLDTRFRGQGMGTRLIAEAEQRVAAQGHARMTLNVYKENARAVDFYGRRGWEVDKEYMGQIGRPMLIMYKELQVR